MSDLIRLQGSQRPVAELGIGSHVNKSKLLKDMIMKYWTGAGKRAFQTLVCAMMVLMAVWTRQALANDLVVPDPAIAPVEVVAIQLKALQFNDNPTPDFGILQTWNFAHPSNRAVTGPLPRFAAMIKGPAFSPLINHNSHEISPSADQPGLKRFDVLMETALGQVLYFQWSVEKVTSGEYENCWMTVGVSMPRIAGQGS